MFICTVVQGFLDIKSLICVRCSHSWYQFIVMAMYMYKQTCSVICSVMSLCLREILFVEIMA